MMSYSNLVNDPHYFVNMDETAVYMNCSPNRMIHRKGTKTVSVMTGGAKSTRFTLAVAVVMD